MATRDSLTRQFHQTAKLMMLSRAVWAMIVIGVDQHWTHFTASGAQWYFGTTVRSGLVTSLVTRRTIHSQISLDFKLGWNLNPVDSYFGPVWGSALSPPRDELQSPCNSGGRPWRRLRHPVYTRCASHSCMKEEWRAFHPNSRDARAHLCIGLLEWRQRWEDIRKIC